MAKIGLIAMSGKPYHIGHHKMVVKAARECDTVELFVSLSDRKRPGELPILGVDMKRIWEEQLVAIMPENVNVHLGGTPVRLVWEVLGTAEEQQSEDVFVVYADEDDLKERFTEKSLNKYSRNLFANDQIILSATERAFSGTKMRQMIASGDQAGFISKLPKGVDGNAIWEILSSRIPQTESMLRQYVRLLVAAGRKALSD